MDQLAAAAAAGSDLPMQLPGTQAALSAAETALKQAKEDLNQAKAEVKEAKADLQNASATGRTLLSMAHSIVCDTRVLL